MIRDFIKKTAEPPSSDQHPESQKKPKIADMRWILNDTFLMVLTSEHEILFFDALLQVFQINLSHEDTVEYNLFTSITKQISQGGNPDTSSFKILGFQNQVNLHGLPVQTNNQFIGVFDCSDPK